MPEPLVKVSFESEGFAELRRALKSCNVEVMRKLTQALVENTEDLLGESMKRAPVDEGFLRGSGSARVNRGGTSHGVRGKDEAGLPTATLRAVSGSDIGALVNAEGAVVEGEVSFNTVYAARQHEELGWKHPRGGEAKYLENPLKERTPKYLQNLAKAAKEALRRAHK